MIIKNYNDKKYIELTKDKVIIYKWYGKVTLKREKIKGAVVFDDMIMKILYGNRYRGFSITNVKSSDTNLLNDFIKSLNKEYTICSLYDKEKPLIFSIIMLFTIINNFDISSIRAWIFSSLIMFLFFGWPIYFTIFNPIYDIFIYNYKDGIIELRSTFTKRYKKLMVDKAEIKITLNKERQYIFSYNGRSNVYIPKNVIYPVNYIQVLKELYNSKNSEEFNNEEITFCYYCGADAVECDRCLSCGKRLVN